MDKERVQTPITEEMQIIEDAIKYYQSENMPKIAESLKRELRQLKRLQKKASK